MEELEVSDSLRYLIDWYTEYAKEVVRDRAIPNIDGFKPSQRRILYAMHDFEKVKALVKSSAVVGSTAKLHPHGDASIYDTLVRMVDSSLRQSVPFVHGKGSFGRVYSNKPPASQRYTEVMFCDIAKELFSEMNGVTLAPSEDAHYFEPDALPVSFPTILTNPVSGIAVGLASNIPAFNFHEVIEATIDIIKTGSTNRLLAPDFSSKGYYVYDEAELEKVMKKGKGVIKLRGKWHIDGKFIVITELPYYTTQEAVAKKIRESNIRDVVGVGIESDFDGLKLVIDCRSKSSVDAVLSEVLRLTGLQLTITTNLTVIINDKPRLLGVIGLLKEWVEFRKSVLKKSLSADLESVQASIDRYGVFYSLLSDSEKRKEFIDVLVKRNHLEASNVLRTWFPSTDQSIIDWILDMKLRNLSDSRSVLAKLNGLKSDKATILSNLADLPSYIVSQLMSLNVKYSYPRKTEITHKDYVFSDVVTQVVKAEPIDVIVQLDKKFIKKMKCDPTTSNLEGLRCKSNDVISYIDNQGRLLRVHLENIDFHSTRDKGLYLPVFLGIDDDFEIVVEELISDKKVGYLYSDGYVGVVNYSEWTDSKRATKITYNGVSPLSGGIVGDFDFSKNYLVVFTRKGKFGFVELDFKEKHRTSRTKLIDVKKDDELTSCFSASYVDLLNLVSSPESYMGKLSLLSSEDSFNSEYLANL